MNNEARSRYTKFGNMDFDAGYELSMICTPDELMEIKMFKNKILEEIHKIREEYAKSFNHDLQPICDKFHQRKNTSSRKKNSEPLKPY